MAVNDFVWLFGLFFDLQSVMCFSCKCLNIKHFLTLFIYRVVVHIATDLITLDIFIPQSKTEDPDKTHNDSE